MTDTKDDTIAGIREFCKENGQPCDSLENVYIVARTSPPSVWLAADTNEEWIAAAIASIYKEALNRNLNPETLQNATMQAMMRVANEFQAQEQSG